MSSNDKAIEKTLSFGLTEISKWQLDFDNSKVELPALQRGFVWKVNQIESLWDSVLRGFPIGSFLLSKSEDEKLFLLDGQQRATSIALGFYNPWNKKEKYNFWSLKNIPIIWIDLSPNEKTNTQKFVIRVVTQSHPWGYQRKDNNSILTVSDRRNALQIFRENPDNKNGGYIQLSPLNVFPYDTDLPVPLSFLIKAISEQDANWKDSLIEMCKENLPLNIRTKHFGSDEKSFLERLTETLHSSEFGDSIFNAIKNLEQVVIPAIVVKQEILKAEDEQTGEDPTLFVRLNSSGTRIAGEELIYSIYKASFPEAKKLVENIGASFVAPSLVISLVSRLALTEINESKYPSSISVNDFRKRIKDENFKNKLRELIGTESNSPASLLFNKAFEILLSKTDFAMPPVLVKSIVKGSPDLFLLLLQWIKLHDGETKKEVRQNILATLTALSWFGRDNTKYVRELWSNIPSNDFWSKQILSAPYLNKKDFIMYPMIQPSTLREFLLESVVAENVHWNNLYPTDDSEIINTYKSILNTEAKQETEIANAAKGMWDNFMNKLFRCKPLVLFAQREYINKSFGEFNQMENLEDTNTPWDWDHIYPDSWVYYQQTYPLIKEWNNCIGNYRALSLEQNRSDSNTKPPYKKFYDEELPEEENKELREQSFVKENDGNYWKQIKARIYQEGDVKSHSTAVINRMVNIYEAWYSTLNVGELFGY